MDTQSHLHSGGDGDASVIIDQVLLRLQDAVSMAMSRIRQRVMQSFIVFSVVSLLLWLAAFLYGSFYYSYMPRAAFSTPVHYHYRCVCLCLSVFSCIKTTQTTVNALCLIPSFLFLLSSGHYMFLSVGQTVNLLLLFTALTL